MRVRSPLSEPPPGNRFEIEICGYLTALARKRRGIYDSATRPRRGGCSPRWRLLRAAASWGGTAPPWSVLQVKMAPVVQHTARTAAIANKFRAMESRGFTGASGMVAVWPAGTVRF